MSEEQEQAQEQCSKPCEVWSRVTGFYSPLNRWNAAKREEYEQRRKYDATKL